MTSLFNRAPKASYQELLKIDNTGAGVDSGLRTVQDGLGNDTPLQLSSTKVSLNGAVWPSQAGDEGQVLTANADGTMSWKTAANDNSASTLITGNPSSAGYPLVSTNNQLYNLICANGAVINLPALSTLTPGWCATVLINAYGTNASIVGNSSPQDYIINGGTATGAMNITAGFSYIFTAMPAINRWMVFKSM